MTLKWFFEDFSILIEPFLLCFACCPPPYWCFPSGSPTAEAALHTCLQDPFWEAGTSTFPRSKAFRQCERRTLRSHGHIGSLSTIRSHRPFAIDILPAIQHWSVWCFGPLWRRLEVRVAVVEAFGFLQDVTDRRGFLAWSPAGGLAAANDRPASPSDVSRDWLL